MLLEACDRPDVEAAAVTDDRAFHAQRRQAEPAPIPLLHGPRVAEKAAAAGDVELFEEALEAPAVDLVRDAALGDQALRVLRLSGDLDYLSCEDLVSEPAPCPAAALERGLLGIALGDWYGARAQLGDASTTDDWLVRGCARHLGAPRAAQHWSAAQRLAGCDMPRVEASRLFSCLAASNGARFASACRRALDELRPENRRLF